MTSENRSLGFRYKILVTAIVLILLSMSVVVVVSYLKSKKEIEKVTLNKLLLVKENVKGQVESLIKNNEIFARRLSINQYIEELYIVSNKNYLEAGIRFGSDQNFDIDSYKNIEKKYLEESKKILNDFKFANFYLVNKESQILYTGSDQKEHKYFLGKNLKNGSLKDSSLGSCIADAMNSEDKDIHYTGFEYFQGQKSINAFFCIKKNAVKAYVEDGVSVGDLLGVLVLELDLESINKIILPREDAIENMEQVYIVGDDFKLRTNISLDAEKYNVKSSFAEDIVVDHKSVKWALNDKKGHRYIKGPHQKEVLSVYDSFKVFDRTWAIIVEKNVKEIMAPILKILQFVLFISVGMLVLTLIISFQVTNKINEGIVYILYLLRKTLEDLSEVSDKSERIGEIENGLNKVLDRLDQFVLGEKKWSFGNESTSFMNGDEENLDYSSIDDDVGDRWSDDMVGGDDLEFDRPKAKKDTSRKKVQRKSSEDGPSSPRTAHHIFSDDDFE